MKDMILGRNDDVRFAQLLAHQFQADTAGKRLELLREVVPGLRQIEKRRSHNGADRVTPMSSRPVLQQPSR